MAALHRHAQGATNPSSGADAEVVWHIIAGEYPPDSGGVSDYTALVAEGLADAGQRVHVWTGGKSEVVTEPHRRISVHRCGGDFGPSSLRRLHRHLDAFPQPRRILVQYVPHAFGYKALNLPFAYWVRSRATRHRDDVRIMFHEVAYPWVRSPLRHNLIAAINERMVRIMVATASKMYVSTAAWNERLVRLGAKPDNLDLLPIPSNIPEATDRAASEAIRESLLAGKNQRVIIGHFGTYGANVCKVLQPIVERLLVTASDCHLHLIGGGSEAFLTTLAARLPGLTPSVSATGRLLEKAVGQHIQACDVMLQPYGDGASTRRSSLMACLINRRATVSTTGPNCEPLWAQQGIIRLAKLSDPSSALDHITELVEDVKVRDELGERAYQYYQQHLSSQHHLTVLTGAAKN